MRFLFRILLAGFCVAASARAQSTEPILADAIPDPQLAPGGPAVTIDLRNYFAVPGLTSVPPGYDSIFPTGGGRSVITFALVQQAPALASVVLSGSTLTFTPAGSGSGSVVIRAANEQGAGVTVTVGVTISATPPIFETQPRSLTMAAGSTAVLDAQVSGAYRFRWERDGQTVQEGSSSALVISPATASHAGSYQLIAINAHGETRTSAAQLGIVDTAPQYRGRLINLSILMRAGLGDKALTVGAVVGPLDSAGELPLVMRAVGPTLGPPPFYVPDTLQDPTMAFYAAGSASPIDSNDNWGGSEAMRTAFASVGAFALPADSLDSAIVRRAPGVGAYTVQVTGKGDSEGAVLAEIYDASGDGRTSASPRLINVSALVDLRSGDDMTVGFVISGQTARTVLVRGAGPALARFGVTGTMRDPELHLYDTSSRSQILGRNRDWGGALEIGNAAQAVGAFPFGSGVTKDAALLVTLPPGSYTARLHGGSSGGGKAIVEVYEVP
ncbi:MAG TPA: immunoglobulin domain-containing protein [Opitutaceae bacterium]